MSVTHSHPRVNGLKITLVVVATILCLLFVGFLSGSASQNTKIDGLQSQLTQQTRTSDCLSTSLSMVTTVDLLAEEVANPAMYKSYPDRPIKLRFPIGESQDVAPFMVKSDSWILKQLFWQIHEQQKYCGWEVRYTEPMDKYRDAKLADLTSDDVAKVRGVLSITTIVYGKL